MRPVRQEFPEFLDDLFSRHPQVSDDCFQSSLSISKFISMVPFTYPFLV